MSGKFLVHMLQLAIIYIEYIGLPFTTELKGYYCNIN